MSNTPYPLGEPYIEKLYAGILGKAIGIYLGHPFEGQTCETILKEYGEVWGYAHADPSDIPTPDDDLTGTLLFPRALEDGPFDLNTLAHKVARVWLNSLVEDASVLAWSGKGVGTEHTAYLNLKNGIMPPQSGSAEINGPMLAEQVGGQIFIDGWGMIAPGSPELAVKMAEAAASVSHAGEAVYAGCLVAAMNALAFTETLVPTLVEKALAYIPADSVIARMDKALLELSQTQPDWREAYRFVKENHSYDHYPGKCPVIPNHALVILALLWGKGNFARSTMIVNTCGWDSDGNSANVGAILGILYGVQGILADYDFITPMGGIVYVPFAEGGEAITDAERLTYNLASLASKVLGREPEISLEQPRFSFNLPASCHGFESLQGRFNCACVKLNPDTKAAFEPGLVVEYGMLTQNRTVEIETRTLEDLENRDRPYYVLSASPTLYPGQKLEAKVVAETQPVQARLYARFCGQDNERIKLAGEYTDIQPGKPIPVSFTVPSCGGRPVGRVGLELRAKDQDTALTGRFRLLCLDWQGAAGCELIPEDLEVRGEQWWRYCWVGNVDLPGRPFNIWAKGPMRVSKTRETGVLSQGTRDWKDYTIQADFMPYCFQRGGIALRCQGLNRYLALVLCEEKTLKLVARYDDQETILDQADFAFEFGQKLVHAELSVKGQDLSASVAGLTLKGTNPFAALISGAAAVVVEDGSIIVHGFRVVRC